MKKSKEYKQISKLQVELLLYLKLRNRYPYVVAPLIAIYRSWGISGGRHGIKYIKIYRKESYAGIINKFCVTIENESE